MKVLLVFNWENCHLINFESSFLDNFEDGVLPDKVARAKGKEERLAWGTWDWKVFRTKIGNVSWKNRKTDQDCSEAARSLWLPFSCSAWKSAAPCSSKSLVWWETEVSCTWSSRQSRWRSSPRPCRAGCGPSKEAPVNKCLESPLKGRLCVTCVVSLLKTIELRFPHL